MLDGYVPFSVFLGRCFQDEKSVASGVGRILTAAMRSAGFVAGFVPMTLNDEHVPEDVIDQTQLQNQTRPS